MGAPCSPAGELLGPSSCHQPGAAPGCLSAAGCHRVLWVRAFQTEALRWSVTGFLAGPREALVLGCTFLCGGSSKGRPQCSEWTANSWKLAISPNFRTHVCICQRNIQIQYRPAKNVDLVSRQMAAQRLTRVWGTPSTPFPPLSMCKKLVGSSRPQLHGLQHSKPRAVDSYKASCLPVSPEPDLELPLYPVPLSAKGSISRPYFDMCVAGVGVGLEEGSLWPRVVSNSRSS